MDHFFQKTLFIFRRDLRLDDNTGLIFALKQSREVIPCFIFTPEQIHSNPYLGDHSLQFLIESLEDLEKQLESRKSKLYLFYGKSEEVIKQCIQRLHIDAVIVNRDYTPYSTQRDCKIQTLCKKEKVAFYSLDDALLQPPENTLNKEGKPYKIFTPFYRNSCKLDVKEPEKNQYSNFYKNKIEFTILPEFYKEILPKRTLVPAGGRSNAMDIFKQLKSFGHYETLRDFPGKDGTTHLSAHLKFTTCSPREVYHAILKSLGPSSMLIRSLYWRDFFSSIAFYFPYVFNGAFHKKYNDIEWSYNKESFTKWCDGKTGFPIVDAGMRELNQTGFMHNRLRMIVGSFLVKDLHIDWRWGEKYFAQKLSDYDPAINNCNWQWVAGTGCDAQPYFRIFNPWTQAKTYDPDCVYIKKWIPELVDVPIKTIHQWDREKTSCSSYPLPMLDHSQESKNALKIFYKIKSNVT